MVNDVKCDIVVFSVKVGKLSMTIQILKLQFRANASIYVKKYNVLVLVSKLTNG